MEHQSGDGWHSAVYVSGKIHVRHHCSAELPNDFVVFPVNALGSATQPNIVAFDNLYSGTAGGNGICNRAATAEDTGTSATVLWSYNVEGIAGGSAVTTSPVLSYDPLTPANSGTKVAFVESAAAGQIKTAAVTAGHAGTGYVVGDAGTISGGTGLSATYQVVTVTGGAVTSFTITYAGTGYAVVAGAATLATSGAGTGFEVNITAVTSVNAAHFHVLAWGTGTLNGENALESPECVFAGDNQHFLRDDARRRQRNRHRSGIR